MFTGTAFRCVPAPLHHCRRYSFTFCHCKPLIIQHSCSWPYDKTYDTQSFMGHGNYDDPRLTCHTRAAPSCDIFNLGSSYFHVPLTTVRHPLNVTLTILTLRGHLSSSFTLSIINFFIMSLHFTISFFTQTLLTLSHVNMRSLAQLSHKCPRYNYRTTDT